MPEIDSAQLDQITFARTVLKTLQSEKDRLPLDELLELSFELTGYDAALLLEPLGSRKLANLYKLVSTAEQFSLHGKSLLEYALYLNGSVFAETKEKLAATSPEQGDTVRLMTIHQSKGLEFPIVFVADMNRGTNRDSAGAVLHPDYGPLISPPKALNSKDVNPMLQLHRYREKKEDDAESLRKLYVAMTRAKDYLVCSAGLSPEKSKLGAWLNAVAQSYAIDTGLPVGDPYLGTQLGGETLTPADIPEIRVHHKKPKPEIASQEKSKRIRRGELNEIWRKASPSPFDDLTNPFPVDPAAKNGVVCLAAGSSGRFIVSIEAKTCRLSTSSCL